MLETRRPRSWLKTVSAFANERGGFLVFGVADDGSICGLADIRRDIDIISKQIKERIAPLPTVDIRSHHTDDGKDIILLHVMPGD